MGPEFSNRKYEMPLARRNEMKNDDRGWNNNVSARERLFALALEALCKL